MWAPKIFISVAHMAPRKNYEFCIPVKLFNILIYQIWLLYTFSVYFV